MGEIYVPLMNISQLKIIFAGKICYCRRIFLASWNLPLNIFQIDFPV